MAIEINRFAMSFSMTGRAARAGDGGCADRAARLSLAEVRTRLESMMETRSDQAYFIFIFGTREK